MLSSISGLSKEHNVHVAISSRNQILLSMSLHSKCYSAVLLLRVCLVCYVDESGIQASTKSEHCSPPPLSPLLPPLEFRSSYASTPTWVVTPKGFQYSIFASLNEVSNTQSVWAPPLLCYSTSNTETWLKYATELCSIFYHTHNLLLSSLPFQITCQQCGRVSEREEEFLDIPVALSSRASLEQALNDMYIHTEMLEGPNQYHCENCQRLVDAKRVSTN